MESENERELTGSTILTPTDQKSEEEIPDANVPMMEKELREMDTITIRLKEIRYRSEEEVDIINLSIGDKTDSATPSDVIKNLQKLYEKDLELTPLKTNPKRSYAHIKTKKKSEQLGVTTIIENYQTREDAWKNIPNPSEYSEVYSVSWDPNDVKHSTHDSGLSLMRMVTKLGLDILTSDEFPVADLNLSIRKTPEVKDVVTPVGSLDLLAYDRKENKYVVIDLKTKTQLDKIPHISSFLKTKYLIQLEFYAYLLEKMAANRSVDVQVGYTMIVGYDTFRGQTIAWKIKRNTKKYLFGSGLQDVYYPILT